jgi:hypothetical protein
MGEDRDKSNHIQYVHVFLYDKTSYEMMSYPPPPGGGGGGLTDAIWEEGDMNGEE